MAVNDRAESSSVNTARIIAFFQDRNDAHRAVSDLKAAGFTSDNIGIISTDDRYTGQDTDDAHSGIRSERGEHESFWDKMKNFFTGETHDDVDYRDSISGMNWDQSRADYYYQGIGRGGALVSVTGPRTSEAATILERDGGDLRESGFETSGLTSSAAGSNRTASHVSADTNQRIQLRGEILRTYKERVQRGEVRLRKEVVTENQTVEVPVTREELIIERVPASGTNQAVGQIGSDQEIRVPLSEEKVRVEKQPVVTEEVRVGKRAVQNNERVSDNVRHEELRVEKDGDVDVNTDVTRKSKKPAA